MDRLFCQLIDQELPIAPDSGNDEAEGLDYCRLDAIVELATDHPLTEAQKISAQKARERYGMDNFNYIEVQCHRDVNICDDSEYISFSIDEMGELGSKGRESFRNFTDYVRERTKHNPDFVRYHSNIGVRISPEHKKFLDCLRALR